jgi:hypothetical protein
VVGDLLLNERGKVYDHVSYPGVRRLIANHNSGHLDNSRQIWGLLVLSAWLEKEAKLS